MNPGNLPLRLWQRHSWRAKPCAARQVLRNAALRRDNRVVLDCKMANDPDLAGHHHFFSDAGAAGNARLRGDDGMLSNNDVVRDLHEIVDLNAFLDPGPTESSAIDGCVCPDLNVVVNLDNSELRNFLVTAFDEFEPKTVRADYCTAVNNGACADSRLFANGYVRINQARRADNAFVSDVAAGADHGVVTDCRARFDDRMRLNRDAASDFCSWIDNRCRMNARPKSNRFGRQFQDNLLKGFRRVGHADLRGRGLPGKIQRNKNRRCPCLPKARQITRIGVKRDLARGRFRERCGPVNFQRRITAQFSSAKGREFLKSKTHVI